MDQIVTCARLDIMQNKELQVAPNVQVEPQQSPSSQRPQNNAVSLNLSRVASIFSCLRATP